ncbi:hypothetical protein VNI00_014986 [Paramarasmius palmivorus]|uniref:DUF590-domain-containing protein n=1 Tax=Paramarasmius palmivorus TaxID=297713 RepID=A0AAW0BP05_9AGAR
MSSSDPSPSSIDLVISFRSSSSTAYTQLLHLLHSSGLQAVGRQGDSSSHILIFIRSPSHLLHRLLKAERDEAFLSGFPVPPSSTFSPSEPISPADRVRLVHQYISSLGISPEAKEWSPYIEKDGIFCLHDKPFNDEWIHAYTTGKGRKISLERLRQQFGEQVALYFAFLHTYTYFLAFPAGIGLLFYIYGSKYGNGYGYNPIYSTLLVLWCIVFTEYWRIKERLILTRFGSYISTNTTNTKKTTTPWYTHYLKSLSTIPILALCSTLLITLLTALFILEAFVSHLYTGPLPQLFSLLPTLLFVLLVPRLVALFGLAVERLTLWEGHIKGSDAYERSVLRKQFVFTALVAYGGLALSAFVYVPFGSDVVGFVQIWIGGFGLDAFQASSEMKLDEGRLRNQMFAYTVTNQIVNAFQEVGLPFVLRRVEAFRAKKTPSPSPSPQTSSLVKTTLTQLTLPPYTPASDQLEMLTQFGYIAIWSTIWPLAPVMGWANDLLEGRGDALKICVHARRALPKSTSTTKGEIWTELLEGIAWLGE